MVLAAGWENYRRAHLSWHREHEPSPVKKNWAWGKFCVRCVRPVWENLIARPALQAIYAHQNFVADGGLVIEPPSAANNWTWPTELVFPTGAVQPPWLVVTPPPAAPIPPALAVIPLIPSGPGALAVITGLAHTPPSISDPAAPTVGATLWADGTTTGRKGSPFAGHATALDFLSSLTVDHQNDYVNTALAVTAPLEARITPEEARRFMISQPDNIWRANRVLVRAAATAVITLPPGGPLSAFQWLGLQHRREQATLLNRAVGASMLFEDTNDLTEAVDSGIEFRLLDSDTHIPMKPKDDQRLYPHCFPPFRRRGESGEKRCVLGIQKSS